MARWPFPTVLFPSLSVLAVTLVFVSCSGDRNMELLAPEEVEAPRPVALECTADVVGGTLTCAAPSPTLLAGARASLTLGGQGTNILLASENVCFEDECEPDAPAGVFQADVRVTNLIGQAIGTVDGEAVHETGVRVFFHTGPVVVTTDGEPGTAEVHNADGTGTFTASNQAYFQYDEVLAPNATSAAKTWQWLLTPNVRSFEFSVLVSAEVRHPNGWIDVTPAVDTLTVGDPDAATTQLTAVVRDVLGGELEDETVTWSSGDTTKVTVDSTGLVTAVGDTGWVTVTATAGVRTGKAEIFVASYVPPLGAEDDVFPVTVLGNVSIASGASGFSVTANDGVPAGATITFVGWNGVAGKTQQGGDVSMTASGDGMGEFTYDPPAGYEGTDAFIYVLSVGEHADTATVTLTVGGMVWFIDNTASACTSVANGCGRLSSPFSSLDAFRTANNNAGNNPGDGDVVFLYESATDYVLSSALVLRPGQKLIGQDATESLEQILGITAPVGSPALPAVNAANGTRARIVDDASGIVLSTNNTLRGFTVSTTGGVGIQGSGFGTLTLGGDVEVVSTNGPAINLSSGHISGSFRSVSANGGGNGIVLWNTTGTFEVTGTGTANSGGTIQNSTGDGISLTNTGPVSLSWMTISANKGSGIRGDAVTGFHLRRSTLENNGDAADEHGIRFTSLTGTARIDTVQIRGSYNDEVYIANSGGTLDLYMYGNDISDTAMSPRDGGVRIRPSGSAVINVTFVGNTIGNHTSFGLSYVAEGTAGGTVLVENNTFGATNNRGIHVVAGEATTWQGTLDFDVKDNTVTGSQYSIVVGAWESGPNGKATGYVRGNTVGTPGVPRSCGYNGITANGNGAGNHRTAITDNVVHECRSWGLNVQAISNGPGRHDAVVQANTVTMSQDSDSDVLWPESFFATVLNSTLCLVAGHPTQGSLKNSLDHRLDKGFTDDLVVGRTGNTLLILEGYTGGNDDGAIASFLSNSNTYQGGGPAQVFLDTATGIHTVTGGTCNRP